MGDHLAWTNEYVYLSCSARPHTVSYKRSKSFEVGAAAPTGRWAAPAVAYQSTHLPFRGPPLADLALLVLLALERVLLAAVHQAVAQHTSARVELDLVRGQGEAPSGGGGVVRWRGGEVAR